MMVSLCIVEVNMLVFSNISNLPKAVSTKFCIGRVYDICLGASAHHMWKYKYMNMQCGSEEEEKLNVTSASQNNQYLL